MRIEDFPMAWRWTQKSHADFPPDVLARIKPIESSVARELYQRGERAFSGEVIGDERSCSTERSDEARGWLRSLGFPAESPVTVVWSSELGVALPWGVFVEYWDDFCYPSSDDAFIILSGGSDVISYEHHEMFRHKSGVA